MRFRDIDAEILDVLGRATWLGAEHEITVIRDLEGRVRLLVESPTAGQDPDPEGGHRARLESELRQELGPWLGEHTPVWQAPTNRDAALVELIRQERRRVPTPGDAPWKLWRLDRHAGRHGWVGDLPHQPPWTTEEVDAGDRPPIAVFFSQKGGVGRSTALAATALHLARAGNKILVLDLDLEAPGVGEMFLDPAHVELGVLDLLVGPAEAVTEEDVRFSAQAVTEPAVVGTAGGSVLVVPAGRVDEAYVQMLARLDLQGAREASAMSRRIGGVLRILCDEYQPDAVLVDARAGFHDVGGIALSALCHGAVFVGLSNPQSWHGLGAVARVLRGAGVDADGDPIAWLQVVHGLAAPRAQPEEEQRFRDDAYDLLSQNWYSEGRVPSPDVEGVPHDVIVVRWQAELRGKGGRLDAEVADRLAGEGFRALAERLARWHSRLRWDR